METNADMMAIGDHCCSPGCGQIDFLPFKCDCCSRTFCLDHRSYAAHACAQASGRQTEVIVCPLCARGVRLQPGQDPNLAFEQHTKEGCDPSHYAKVHHKARCPVPRCQERLSLINTYQCKTCSMRVCLKHRMPDDHACAEARAAAALRRSQPAAAKAPPPVSAKPSAPPLPTPSRSLLAAARRQYEDPSNSVKGTVERRKQELAAASGSAAATNVNPLVQPERREECPLCGARFMEVAQLVQHVEEWHPTPSTTAAATTHSNPLFPSTAPPLPGAGQGAGQVGAAGDTFRCSYCQARFEDPVALVTHSERCGARGASVATAGGPAPRGTGRECCIS